MIDAQPSKNGRADRTEALRSVPRRRKEEQLRSLGLRPEEHPLSGPCRSCGYDRRYHAFPDRCLYCEAVN